MNATDIITAIDKHTKTAGAKYYNDFYIGISDNDQIIFTKHKVKKDKDWWIIASADTKEVASEVKKHYLDLGMDGDKNSNQSNFSIIYCYKITPFTIEKTDAE